MRIISLLLALASVGYADWPPANASFTGSASKNGLSYQFATVAEPPGSDRQAVDEVGSGFRLGPDDTEHRVFWNDRKQSYFGYDILAVTAPGGACSVKIAPLSMTLDQFDTGGARAAAGGTASANNIDRSNYQLLALPAYPAPQLVNPQDTIAIDLLVSPDGKQKVVDYIRVACRGTASRAAAPEGRDFSVRDLQLHMVDPEVTINGQTALSLRGDESGNVVWLAIPGKGRFMLSVAPIRGEGFRVAGTVRDRDVRFESGSDRYIVRLAAPMVPGDGEWNLYVRSEPSYVVKQAGFGAAKGIAR